MSKEKEGKRDVINEILEKRARVLKRGDRWDEFNRRNHALIDAANLLRALPARAPGRAELLKYLSIGTVASLEGYFRRLIADLINFGEPFSTRAAGLPKLTMDVSTILRLGEASITPGEFIAHQLPLSNPKHIELYVATLLDVDYWTALRNTEIPYIGVVGVAAPTLYQEIQKLYEQRHVYCHELAVKARPTQKSETRYLGMGTLFALGNENLALRMMSGNEDLPEPERSIRVASG